MGNSGHAHTGFIGFAANVGKMLEQNFTGFGMVRNLNTESLGHAVRRNIVVCGPYATCGEHIGVSHPQGINCSHNIRFIISDHAGLFQIDTQRGQIISNKTEIFVLGAA